MSKLIVRLFDKRAFVPYVIVVFQRGSRLKYFKIDCIDSLSLILTVTPGCKVKCVWNSKSHQIPSMARKHAISP